MTVNDFNQHFSTIGRNLAAKFDSSIDGDIGSSCSSSMFLTPVTVSEIFLHITSLKPSNVSGHDNITNNMLKASACVIAEFLTHLINQCFLIGVFPSSLKIARVIPILKSGDMQNPNNYRPISILPSLSKIFEKAIHKRLDKFFEQNKLLFSKQFGFRKSKSTKDALSSVLEYITKNIDGKKSVAGIFLDLSKAFDTVNHDVLLLKLENYGVRGIVKDLVASYLSSRQQYVQVGCDKSKCQNIVLGVPQGSVLGPILFNIYINDMHRSLTHDSSHLTLFADDAALFSESDHDPTHQMQIDCDNIKKWLDKNKLTLNTSKTFLIKFNKLSRYKTKLTIVNKEIEEVSSSKYLGLVIDKNLNFKDHIKDICSKMAKFCGFLKFASPTLNLENRVKFYNYYVKPVIEYGLRYYGSTSATNLKPILLMQKRMIRIIYQKSFRYPTDTLFQISKIATVYELYAIELLKFLTNLNLESLSHPVQYNTRSRSRGLLRPMTFRSTVRRNFYENRAVNLYNKLKNLMEWPNSIHNSTSYKKKAFIKHCSELFIVGNSDIKEVVF